MLIRIVRMHFREDAVAEFVRIFDVNKTAIRNFQGCTHLELLRDVNIPFTYTTLSHWKDEESLDRYRKSEVFSAVWRNVKPLFSKKPEAFSLTGFIE